MAERRCRRVSALETGMQCSVRQMRWCAAVQTLVNCHCQLEEPMRSQLLLHAPALGSKPAAAAVDRQDRRTDGRTDTHRYIDLLRILCGPFCSLAVVDPRVGHTVDALSPFISMRAASIERCIQGETLNGETAHLR